MALISRDESSRRTSRGRRRCSDWLERSAVIDHEARVTKRHRGEVVAWLENLESLAVRAAARQDPGAFDVRWNWEELGLGEFRS